MQVIILGSGTSTGVPVIGCGCEVCRSSDPKNKRTRASILLRLNSHQYVVDTGPDFRAQMLRENVDHLDAVFYTHVHADHCHGFDDLRAFYFISKKDVDCYIASDFGKELNERFGYAFQSTGYKGTTPQVNLITIPDEGTFQVDSLKVEVIRVPHGNVRTTVYRFGNFVYATDFKRFEEDQIAAWQGKIHTMVASGVRFEPHPTHSNITETIELMERLGVKRGVIGHLSHNVDYLRDRSRLPEGIEFAYDGMVIDVPEALS